MGNKYSRFFAILKEINTNGGQLTKEQAVHDYTNKRTTSLTDLSDQELYGLEQALSSISRPRGIVIVQVDAKADRMRKGIISQFLSIGKTAQAAKDWAEKYGVQGKKRKFDDYTHQELWLLLQNAKKMKADHIKALNKK